MFCKILICSDGSECAFNAARTGAVLARHFHAEALALHVCNTPIPSITQAGPGNARVAQSVIDSYVRQQEQSHHALLQPLFEEAEVSCTLLQETGHPVDCIVHAAEREKADLIVLGSRGLRGFQEVLLGSVSNGVLHHSHCSVLIMRGKNAPRGMEGFQHILLVSDGSQGAGKATRAAVEIAQTFAVSLTVLNVAEPYAVPPRGEGECEAPLARIDSDAVACCMLQKVRDSVRDATAKAGVYCSVYQEKGQADATIVRIADQNRSDLIVMGSRGLGGLGRMLLGSVSNYVAHYATCPVLVVR